MAYDVYEVGEAHGLTRRLNLKEEVANFYTSERLFAVTHPRTDDTRSDGLRLPTAFGTDTRKELVQYSVEKNWFSTRDRLAHEFSTYLIMAVGGEARHAPRTAKVYKRPKTAKPKSKPKLPPAKVKNPFASYKDGYYVKYYMGCRYCCAAPAGSMPCGRKKSQNPDLDGKKWWQIPNENCGYSPSAKLSSYHADGLLPGWSKYKPHNDRARKFFEEAGTDADEDNRSTAWDVSIRLYRKYGPDFIKDIHRMFEKYTWDGSFGGGNWANVTGILYDYLVGNIKPEIFVDRCWTLEHNNGCVFNKFYSKSSYIGLRRVLDLQAHDEEHYPKLRTYASKYIQGLANSVFVDEPPVWSGIKKEPLPKSMHDEPPDDWDGCAACWWKFVEHDYNDPCCYGGGADGNEDCAYYEEWKDAMSYV